MSTVSSTTAATLADELPRARRRAEDLARRLVEEEPADLVEVVLTELGTALEELSVAVIQLQEQQDESAVADEEQRQRAARTRALFDANPSAVFVTDGNAVIDEVNTAAVRLLGKPGSFLSGKPLPALVAEGQRRAVYDAMERALGGAEPVRLDLRLVGDDRVHPATVQRTGWSGRMALHWELASTAPPPRRSPVPPPLPRAQDRATLPQELESARALAAQLQRALDTRVVVEQAKGRLAERMGLTPAEAYEVLRRHARSSRRKVHDLAHEVVTGSTGLG